MYRAEWTCFRTGKLRTRSLRTQEKDEALQLLADLLRREKNHATDPLAEHREKPLSEHLEDFRRSLEAKNCSEKHTAKQISYVGKIVDGCDFQTVDDFDVNRVAEYLHDRRRPVPASPVSLTQVAEIVADAKQPKPSISTLKRLKPPPPAIPARRGFPARWEWSKIRQWLEGQFHCSLPRQCPVPDAPGISIHASNDYLAAIKAFSNWMVRSRRLAENPFQYLEKLNPDEERNPKHARRPASDEDFAQLLSATNEAGLFRGLSGQDRAMLYLVAASTGFRASELASLTRDSFDLNSDVPSVTVAAAYSKRRRKDQLPLCTDVAALLSDYLDELQTTRTGNVIPIADSRIVWPGTWAEKAAEMLKADLTAAGVAYQDERGRFLDFHALRHTFASNLAKAGVPPKLAQELMRHSDVNLTMGIYLHVDLPDMAAAVERLPSHDKPVSDQRATGTDSLVAGLVAVKRGDIGDSQEISHETGDQGSRSLPSGDRQHKAQHEQEVTKILPAHEKEPPMRLELMTYALRKRRSAD